MSTELRERENIMTMKSKIHIVSAILFAVDPANVSCVENTITDEYNAEASIIVELICHGESIESAVRNTLADNFLDCYDREKAYLVIDMMKNLNCFK